MEGVTVRLTLGRHASLLAAFPLALLLLAAGGMAATTSARVGTVSFTGTTSHNVTQGGYADYTISVQNNSTGTDRYFKVSSISYATLSAAFTPTPCVQITHQTAPTLTIRVQTTASTPTGSHNFTVNVSDYGAAGCGGTAFSNNTSNNSATIVVAAPPTPTPTPTPTPKPTPVPTPPPTPHATADADPRAHATADPRSHATADPCSHPQARSNRHPQARSNRHPDPGPDGSSHAYPRSH
jgi:hypothetical protein